MNIEVELDLTKILDTYEITRTNGFLSAVKSGAKSIETIELPKYYIDKGIADEDDEFPEGKELTELHKRRERNATVVRKKKV